MHKQKQKQKPPGPRLPPLYNNIPPSGRRDNEVEGGFI